MIGALVSLLSLTMTTNLVAAGVIANTLAITAATTATPIAITVPAHGQVRPVHAVVANVGGMPEATGTWVLTPIDPNTFTLTGLTAQGAFYNSIGTGTYTSGGTAQLAFPDGSILLGRRNIAMATSVASPRIVFVPTTEAAWDFDPYGGIGSPGAIPPQRGSAEQQAQKLQPQQGTEPTTFEVYVSASGPNFGQPLSPDYYDFDAVQAIVFELMNVMFDAGGAWGGQIKRGAWPSQLASAGSMSQRGQTWMGIVEFSQPVVRLTNLVQFVGVGVELIETVTPVGGISGDTTTIVIT